MLSVSKITLSVAIALAVLNSTQVQAKPATRVILEQSPASNPKIQVLNSTQVQAKPATRVILEQSPASNPKIQFNQSLVFAAPPPPPDIGEPGRRSDAGSRGCGGDKQLTALVPVYLNSQVIFGTTIAQHPTFWFYIPYQATFPAKFVLEDKDGKLVYQSDVTLSQKPGVISLSLPRTVAPLLVGKQYHWYLNIYCKQQNPPAFVEGWIQRSSLSPGLQNQLDKATASDRLAIYAANGIWFEALSTASELRRLDPNDTSWATLLQAIGLNNLATEPIVECCTVKSSVKLQPIAQ